MPKVLSQAWDNFFEIQHAQPEDIQELLRKLLEDLQIIREELAEYINSPSWNSPNFYDDDDDDDKYSHQDSEFLKKYPIAIAPVLPTEEPDNSLSMGTSILTLFQKWNRMNDKNHFDVEYDLIESLLTRDTSVVYSPKIDSLLEADELSEDDSFEDIDYVEASPLDSELVSLEEVQDDILLAKLLNIHLLIAKIKSLNNNHTPDCVLKSPSSYFLSYTDNSSPEFQTFSDHTKETSSGSTTTYADNSLPEYDLFFFKIEPDQGEFFKVVMKAILGEPCVYVPNVLPTHPTLLLDSDFIPSDDFLGSGLEVSFPFGTRNKIFNPGIFFEVQSKRFLSRDTFTPTYVSLPFEDRHYLSFTYVI
nr:hypothetical protein [Tanacetum cinerariifolium]